MTDEIVNGDFETGDTTGWAIWGTCPLHTPYSTSVASAYAHTGAYGLQITLEDIYEPWIGCGWWDFCYLSQTIDVTEYDTFSIAVKRNSSYDIHFDVRLDSSCIIGWTLPSTTYNVYEADISGYTGEKVLKITAGVDGGTGLICYDDIILSGLSTGIRVGDNVLLIPNYGDIYDRACIKGGNISVGDSINLHPIKENRRVAIKDRWALNDKITIRGKNI